MAKFENNEFFFNGVIYPEYQNIQVIKAVRAHYGCGLRAAKLFTDRLKKLPEIVHRFSIFSERGDWDHNAPIENKVYTKRFRWGGEVPCNDKREAVVMAAPLLPDIPFEFNYSMKLGDLRFNHGFECDSLMQSEGEIRQIAKAVITAVQGYVALLNNL